MCVVVVVVVVIVGGGGVAVVVIVPFFVLRARSVWRVAVLSGRLPWAQN